MTRKTLDAPWESPENIASIGGIYSTSPSVTNDGLELYFGDGWGCCNVGSPRPGGQGGFDIWVSKRASVEDAWGEPENLGTFVNSSRHEDSPAISADGLSLYFGSVQPGGHGRNDIYVTRRQSRNDPWETPENLGPSVNSSGNEWLGSISADGLTLFFDSNRPGSHQLGDMWVAMRSSVDEEFGNPVHFPPTVNASSGSWDMAMSPDGSALYYGVGHGNNVDIWEAPLLPFESVTLNGAGGTYIQDFDEALGRNTRAHGATLPTGWSGSDNGIIFESTTTRNFPASSSSTTATHFYNAGGEGNPDRSLAVGLPSGSQSAMLQLLTEVSEASSRGFQLQFDVEAWDAERSAASPGEAAFDVTLESDTGNGFSILADLGTATTGTVLQPPTGRLLDGNRAANRVSFDSGVVDARIPEGSTLRIRWAAAADSATEGWVFGLDNVAFSLFGRGLRAGDADQDFDFDQFDLIQVQHSAKYLTGDPATWGDGDWNGAPGGSRGSPPIGDGVFDQLDIIAAQQAAAYLTGPYATVQPDGQAGDDQTSIGYHARTGEVWVDPPAGNDLTSINIDSAASIFTAFAAQNLGGSFDNDADENIFKATFGSSFGALSFGDVAHAGLSKDFVLSDLTVIGSLAGGGDLGNVDLIYVPEPTSGFLFAIGLAVVYGYFGRVDRRE